MPRGRGAWGVAGPRPSGRLEAGLSGVRASQCLGPGGGLARGGDRRQGCLKGTCAYRSLESQRRTPHRTLPTVKAGGTTSDVWDSGAATWEDPGTGRRRGDGPGTWMLAVGVGVTGTMR